VAYEEVNAKEFKKRRKVKWLEIQNTSKLNPIFYKVKSNQHTISDITPYAPFIDQVMGVLFRKNGKMHYVLDIKKTGDIAFEDLQFFMNNVKTLLVKINETFNFNESIDDFSVKINLQSPGSLEFIKKTGKSLAVLAFILATTSCGRNQRNNNSDETIQTFMKENAEILKDTDEVIHKLQIDTKELTRPFNDDVR